MIRRKDPRYPFYGTAVWDYFALGTGRKRGDITEISRSGCLLSTTEPIEYRRWIRLIIQDPTSNLSVTAIGRVARRHSALIPIDIHTKNPMLEGQNRPVYQHGIEFTHPNYFSEGATDLILALSRRNLTVRSCLNLNSKSPIRPGFLA